ncbi:MAG: 3'-5' exonuclease [Parcubacteria group bacterium]|nr:3'-5' exonuclease [Parcubacteria group bacterium]
MRKTYTIFDTETTGLSPDQGDRIIEMAAIKIVDGRITNEKFDELINPERSISLSASAVNGITDEMVENKPTMKKVLPKFLQFVGDSALVAHNAPFDKKFLQAEINQCGINLPIPKFVCTLSLSRKLYSQENRHNLDVVASRMGVGIQEEDRHRALGDVKITAEVFIKFLEIIKSKS